MELAKKGVEKDPKALEAMGCLHHGAREADALWFLENLKVPHIGTGAVTEVVIGGKGIPEFGAGLGAAVRGVERVDASFEIQKVNMAEVTAGDFLGTSSSGGRDVIE
jgi:hypothetical protein